MVETAIVTPALSAHDQL